MCDGIASYLKRFFPSAALHMNLVHVWQTSEIVADGKQNLPEFLKDISNPEYKNTQVRIQRKRMVRPIVRSGNERLVASPRSKINI